MKMKRSIFIAAIALTGAAMLGLTANLDARRAAAVRGPVPDVVEVLSVTPLSPN